MYPVADQLADKICAMVETVGGRRSTRVKDLVDAVIIAKTQRLNTAELGIALRAECSRRGIPYPIRFGIPADWTRMQFVRLSSGTAAEDMSLREAESTVLRLLSGLDSPAGDGVARWDPRNLQWEH